MNYDQSLHYLEKVIDRGIKFGLDNVKTIMDALGNPHNDFPSVIVAGTNGKGSVCAMLARIFTLHGWKAGLYTSPHLVIPEERIRIGEVMISQMDFARHLTVLRRTIDELLRRKEIPHMPTYFETMTCLAYLYFSVRKVDFAFLEVGMGGRFDATNVVDPVATVITTISLEHQKFLGETLSEIAGEKAGIIKTLTPVVCGVQSAEALDTIKMCAAEHDAPFIQVFGEARFEQQIKDGIFTFLYEDHGTCVEYCPSLRGAHQGRNAAVAYKTAEVLSRKWHYLEKRLILGGIESTRWEGRLETVSTKPMVVLDGAHNEEGAMALREYAGLFLPKPITLIYAAMRDKNIESIAQILFPVAERIILTRFPFHKAADPEDLKSSIPECFHRRIDLQPDPVGAFKQGLAAFSHVDSTPSTGGCILIAGSLFLIGEAKKFFKN